MLSSQQTRRAQKIMLLVGLCLGLYYLVVFRPLSKKAASLDIPLRDAWKQVVAAKITTDTAGELDIVKIEKRLRTARKALATLNLARERTGAAVSLDPAIRAKVQEPFQLIDFQIEGELRAEELTHAARVNGVNLAPRVLASFPEYKADQPQASLLWPQLAFLDQVLRSAIQCKVTAIESLELPPIANYQSSTNMPFLHEIPLRVEVVGSMESVSRLLASLPLRSVETKALKLPDVPTTKSSLFIHRFILKKTSSQKPDEVYLDLRVCGFVPVE